MICTKFRTCWARQACANSGRPDE